MLWVLLDSDLSLFIVVLFLILQLRVVLFCCSNDMGCCVWKTEGSARWHTAVSGQVQLQFKLSASTSESSRAIICYFNSLSDIVKRWYGENVTFFKVGSVVKLCWKLEVFLS